MEYLIGILIGLVIALVVGGVGAYLFFSDKQPVVVPPNVPAPASDVPALTTFLTVPFLNRQLQKILVDDAASDAGKPPTTQKLGPVKIKMTGANIQLLPARRARLTTQLTATAIGINIRLAPVTEFTFLPQTGRARIFLNKITLEGVTIPRQWVEGFLESYISEAEAKLNYILAQLQDETNINLFEIETDDEILTLKFA